MKKSIIFLFGIFTTLFACENDVIQEDLLNDPTGFEALQEETYYDPLVHYDGTEFLPEFENNFIGEEVARTIKFLKVRLVGTTRYLPVLEPCGGYTDVILEGNGYVTHLGKSNFYGHYYSLDCTNPVFPVTGKLANKKGDELSIMLYYSCLGDDLNVYQDWIVYDGAGEFENATGELQVIQVYNKDRSDWTLSGSGFIAFCN